MSGETTITIIGNLTADPELRSAAGTPVAEFTVASTPRTFDRNSNEWRDGDPLFLRCSAWREQAENVVDSLRKGDRVIAQVNLKQRSFEHNGQQRTVIEGDVQEVGPALKYATAKVTKRQGGNGGQQRQAPQGGQRGYAQAATTEQTWGPAGGQGDQGQFGGTGFGGAPAGGFGGNGYTR